MAENIFNSCISVGETVWVYYNTKLGQSPQCGDYGYLNAYAKNREEAVINGKHYIKGKITGITWHYNGIQFSIVILGPMVKGVPEKLYTVYIKEPERIYLSL